ncbi:MAG: hypothetical protein QG570_227 [Patescibacteria group bacterium]|nr:hypothetical protein [Patescibacteria group bacterium]
MKIAINGFGRIGRAVFKIILDRIDQGSQFEVVAINDLTPPETLEYLLKYDTVYGRFERPTSFDDTHLVVGGKNYTVYSQKDPLQLPWKDLGVDVVIESTGIFTKSESARSHITAGAKKVLLTAPAKDDGFKTIVLGASDLSDMSSNLISNASCTTNNVTPLLKVLNDSFGVEKSMMTTVHAYTATQSLVDSPTVKDMRRGRAAAQNIVPSSTGAAEATSKALPVMTNKFDGVSLRVPVVCGSISDVTAILSKDVTVEEVNNAFLEASKREYYRNILAFTTQQLVSTDIIKTQYSSIVAGDLTRVVSGNMVKVMAWYDNEWGYSNRVVDLLNHCK